VWLALVLVTAVTLWLSVARLHISSDLSLLFPSQREAAALGRFTRVFGGGDLAVVLLRGESDREVLAASEGLLAELRDKPSVARVLDRAPAPELADPTLAWVHAGPLAREALANALTPSAKRRKGGSPATRCDSPSSRGRRRASWPRASGLPRAGRSRPAGERRVS
jgi:hypothetical protein